MASQEPGSQEIYSAITIFYLPPNTTSKLQPMDQGIIQVLKVYYKKMLMHQYLLHDEKKLCQSEMTRKFNFDTG
uniref:DDE-1 domain-containing protein n=1 Tax=Paramormyrops kingsleyae TaxID=1676925 RepID=A0A3B3SST3_9TELE